MNQPFPAKDPAPEEEIDSEKLDCAREGTDSSLLDERERSDAEHARACEMARADTNEHIRLYRARNAALLRALRKLSDQHDDVERTGAERNAVASERLAYDRKRAAEEQLADQALERERESGERSLAAKVAAERAETNRLLARERLRADEFIEARDEFLGMVAHDLRNFLGSITNGAEMIARISTGSSAEAAHRIKATAAQMAILLSDLLDVSAIEAGALRMECGEHDVAALVRDVVEAFEPLTAGQQIALVARVTEGPAMGRLDPARVFQVLGNLVTNSVRFTPAGGRIDVELAPEEKCHRLSVRDTGCGIPASQLETVFERFKQKSEDGHHGLGLYIAKGIVGSHGGKIWAESGAGMGTVVSFTLPTS